MDWLEKLEKKWRRYAVSNITIHIIFAQFAAFALIRSETLSEDVFLLIPAKVLAGEIWRLVTFIAYPPTFSALWAFFAWYLFWFMGGALEERWGDFRFNLFLLIGYALTVTSSFLTPQFPASTEFLGVSIFLAFAHLYPEFVIYIFFILPVKVKWLAWLAWAGYIGTFLIATGSVRIMILASLANYFLFFGRDIYLAIRFRKRRADLKATARREAVQVHHTCRTCGKTDRSDPDLDFRYCSYCLDDHSCYCMDHLRDHEHVTEEDVAESTT